MTVSAHDSQAYLLGNTAAEHQRLIQQGRLITPMTRRLLADAGITNGMRVLDVGCGGGDVTLMVAEMVGPTGMVVGVDRNPEVLNLALGRTLEAGLRNVTFQECEVATFETPDLFDAIVGRLVLIHNHNPLNVVRRLTRLLRPGGVMAFQEYNFTPHAFQCSPPMQLWSDYWVWLRSTMERSGVQMEMGYSLNRVYRAAALEPAGMRLEAQLLEGASEEQYDWAASTLRSMLPLIEKHGVATAEEIDVDSLSERLRTASLAAETVVKIPALIGAWAQKPAA